MTETIKTVTTVDEYCPWCGRDVTLEVEHPKQSIRCPECGRWIKPCSLCDCDIEECAKCEDEHKEKTNDMKNEGHGLHDSEATDYGTQPLKVETPEPREEVNHPSRYKQNGIEVIEMMRRIWGDDATVLFCQMNAFKYRMRAGYKDDIVQEIRKAEWYENYAKDLLLLHEEKQH